MSQLRIVTYNVHRCLGVDGKLSPGRIAEVIAETGADVVALQELDVRRARSGGVDQAEAIAARSAARPPTISPRRRPVDRPLGFEPVLAVGQMPIFASRRDPRG